jgi:hypothetical protein
MKIEFWAKIAERLRRMRECYNAGKHECENTRMKNEKGNQNKKALTQHQGYLSRQS